MEIIFRDCGDCYACCDGYMIHKVYGNQFGNGKKCCFLVDKSCTIYKDRPHSCSYYQCAWSQQLLPEWMKPNECNVIVSVEVDSKGVQFLKVIEMKEQINPEVYEEIKKFVQEQNTYFTFVPYKKVIPINYES